MGLAFLISCKDIWQTETSLVRCITPTENPKISDYKIKLNRSSNRKNSLKRWQSYLTVCYNGQLRVTPKTDIVATLAFSVRTPRYPASGKYISFVLDVCQYKRQLLKWKLNVDIPIQKYITWFGNNARDVSQIIL